MSTPAAALDGLSALWEEGDGLRAAIERWPLPLREVLLHTLLTAFPTAADPEPEDGFVIPEQRLRQLRDRLTSSLFESSAPDSAAALDRVASLDAGIAERVRFHRANRAARAALASDRRPVPLGLSVHESVRLLSRADYRLIRSDDDLLDVVVEAFTRINEDAGRDVALLYAPADAKDKREHHHEDVLQTYLHLRLRSLLASMVEGVSVDLFREDQVSRRQRLDIRVTAPCRGRQASATVVLEVKWSDNTETRSGLEDQLGRRYLLGERLTHGVFVVGWCGYWSAGVRDSVLNEDLNGLRAHLISQRDGYCAAGQPGQGLRIEPVVLDLRWSHRER